MCEDSPKSSPPPLSPVNSDKTEAGCCAADENGGVAAASGAPDPTAKGLPGRPRRPSAAVERVPTGAAT